MALRIPLVLLLAFVLTMSFAYPIPQHRLSDAATLKIATWNCNGLSSLKKDLAAEYCYDILCLPETHKYTDSDRNTLYSAPPPENDTWSGVSLMLSERVRNLVTHWDFVGSRIVYCRIKGVTCNYFVIGIYIPRSKRTNPDQMETYNELEKLLSSTGARDCIILLGDFNSRLRRNIANHTGRWSIHNRNDEGGDRLLEIMKTFSLHCVSTNFQPPRRHSNATYMNIQPQLPPSQIDHIIVSTRWASSVRDCKTVWGLSIKAHGRKYDHATVVMTFKLKQRTKKMSGKRDIRALKTPEAAKRFEDKLIDEFSKTERSLDTTEAWRRLKDALQSAKNTLPIVQRSNLRKHDTSDATWHLISRRASEWDNLTAEERKTRNKEIKRSVRNDYRDYVNRVVEDIEAADRIGDSTSVFKIAKTLSRGGNGNKFCQPSIDSNGNQITSTEEQLEAWAVFLEEKFSARPNETFPNLEDLHDEEAIAELSLEETEACLKLTKSGKAPGPDEIPAELLRNKTAINELHYLLQLVFETEDIPPDFVLGEMLNFYKKKDKNNRSNYRALGLLNHAYKIFSRILLMRMTPYIDPKLSDMQAGFRAARGCRDNILILTLAIQHLLKGDTSNHDSRGVVTYIDFIAAFDSILHSYMLKALLQYGVPRKYCRLVAKIYQTAAVQVRIQEVSGERKLSRQIAIRRGAIQGDIPSSVYFLVALDKLLKEHGGSANNGIPLTVDLKLNDLEYADDAGLADIDTVASSQRVTNLDSKGNEEAGMSVSAPKSKSQHIAHKPTVSETTENDIANLPASEAFKSICDKCGRAFPNNHGMKIHKARWCKGKRKRKPASRKGTLADRIIKLRKVKQKQDDFPHVMLGNQQLDNVYSFVYLGSEIAGDGDPDIPVKHRTDIGWGRFGEYRKVLTSTKLNVSCRIRLFAALVGSTILHGSSAWITTDQVKRKINGVSSKMLSQITKRSIHEEARSPTFDIVTLMKKRRWSYLGHILRMEDSRMVKRFLTELSPREAPFPTGSLLEPSPYDTLEETALAAQDRKHWTELFRFL